MKVLLIEESETCSECLLGIYNRRWFCLATNKDIDLLKSRYEKPSWCPLRSLPKQFTTDEILMAKDVKTAIEMRAYNDCLEEIVGEIE